jgi:hypothetical protein
MRTKCQAFCLAPATAFLPDNPSLLPSATSTAPSVHHAPRTSSTTRKTRHLHGRPCALSCIATSRVARCPTSSCHPCESHKALFAALYAQYRRGGGDLLGRAARRREPASAWRRYSLTLRSIVSPRSARCPISAHHPCEPHTALDAARSSAFPSEGVPLF